MDLRGFTGAEDGRGQGGCAGSARLAVHGSPGGVLVEIATAQIGHLIIDRQRAIDRGGAAARDGSGTHVNAAIGGDITRDGHIAARSHLQISLEEDGVLKNRSDGAGEVATDAHREGARKGAGRRRKDLHSHIDVVNRSSFPGGWDYSLFVLVVDDGTPDNPTGVSIGLEIRGAISGWKNRRALSPGITWQVRRQQGGCIGR